MDKILSPDKYILLHNLYSLLIRIILVMNLEGNICQKSSGASIQTQQIVSTSPDFNILLKDIISEKEKSHSTKESSNGDW